MKRVTFSEKSFLSGNITAPPSKSLSHRLLFLALISKSRIRIRNLLSARDVDYSLEVCKQFGMQTHPVSSTWIECIPPDNLISNDNTFNCGNSGTTARFLIGLSLAITGKIILSGEFFSRKRPILPMLKAMETIGSVYTMEENGVSVETPYIKKSFLKIPGHYSSQFLSGLIYGIIAQNLRPDIAQKKKYSHSQFTIETTTPVVSYPYLELTQHLFEEYGMALTLTHLPNGCLKVIIPTNKTLPHFLKDEFGIPGDFSSISPLLCAGVLFGKESILIKGLHHKDFQTDHELIEILCNMGADIEETDEGIQINHQRKSAIKQQVISTINCRDHPDLFPALCVMGTYTAGTTTLTHINHIRFKESDRVDTMIRELQKFGVRIEEVNNSVIIYGTSNNELKASHEIAHIEDHRILMALSVFALGLDYNGFHITIENIDRIADSYPDFFHHLHSQNGKFDLE